MKDRLDFLRGSVLARVDEYDKVPSDVLLRELQIYRHLARQDFDNLLAGEDKTNDLLSLSYGDVIERAQLRPMFLYAESMVAADPLFEETRGYAPSDFDAYVAQQMTEYGEGAFIGDEGQWRQRVEDSMRYMLDVAPLVDSGFLMLHPISLLSEPSDPPPIWYSDCEFEDLLPEETMQVFRDAAIVSTVFGPGYVRFGHLEPCTEINIRFEGLPGFAMAKVYMEQEFARVGDPEEIVYLGPPVVPKEPPTGERFEGWVRRSVHEVAYVAFQLLCYQIIMSQSSGASFLTNSPLYSSLLGIDPLSLENQTLAGMTLDLPYFRDASFSDLATVRKSSKASLDAFREDLAERVGNIIGIEGEEKRKREEERLAKAYKHKEIPRLAREIEQNERKWTELAAGGLATSVLLSLAAPGPLTLIGSIVASLGFHSRYKAEKRKLEANGAYFLLQLKNLQGK